MTAPIYNQMERPRGGAVDQHPPRQQQGQGQTGEPEQLPSPAAGQKRPRPLTPNSSAASLPSLEIGGSGGGGSSTAVGNGGGGGGGVVATASAVAPSPWGGVFPFRAAGPRMRVERAFDASTGEHRCVVGADRAWGNKFLKQSIEIIQSIHPLHT